jgi:hypothetical protein
MKRILSALTLLAVTASCGPQLSETEKRAARIKELAKYRIQCHEDYGFEHRTPEWNQCVKELDQAAKSAGRGSRIIFTPPPPPQTVIINPQPVLIGGVTCVGNVCY